LQHLETAHVFMEKARADKQGRKVLVHCEHGLNLSGAVVKAYMMHKLSLAPASRQLAGFELLKRSWSELAKRRWPVIMNASFRQQLVLWADSGFGRKGTRSAQQHPAWAPTLFGCHALGVCQHRAEQCKSSQTLAGAPRAFYCLDEILARASNVQLKLSSQKDLERAEQLITEAIAVAGCGE
jgi:hypothetical protein